MFMTQINSSLVDSNMLVRCIILSLDRFESQIEDVSGRSIEMGRGLLVNTRFWLLYGSEIWLLLVISTLGSLSYPPLTPFLSHPSLSCSYGGAVRVQSAVLHGPRGEQTGLPLQARQHHQCADTHPGKEILCSVGRFTVILVAHVLLHPAS